MIVKRRKTETPRDYLFFYTPLCPDAITMVLEYLKPFIFRKERIDRINNTLYFLKSISEDWLKIGCIGSRFESHVKLNESADSKVKKEAQSLFKFFGDPRDPPVLIHNGVYHMLDRESKRINIHDDSIYCGDFHDEFFMCFLDFKILLLLKGDEKITEVWKIDQFG
jgi:hypothetical protein